MESVGNGIYMADLINTNSSSSSSGAAGAGKRSSSFSPVVIAIVGILGTAFLLVSYYTMVAKFCRGRGRGWARRRMNGLNEEAQGLPVAAQVHEQGLEEAEIEAIPVVEFWRRERFNLNSADCAVCLSEFQEAERVRLLPSCCHAFHLACIDVWLRSHASCPLCRSPILSMVFHLPDGPSSSPTSPLVVAAGSGHTSSPLDAASPYRFPIPGDENMHNTPPLSTPKLQPLEPEQFLRREDLAMKLPIKRLDLLIAATRGEREDFLFGRCFSTGRSRGFLNRAPLNSDDAQQHSMSSTSKHTHMGMQRSRSYHVVVGSIWPMLKRHLPNDHLSPSLSRAAAVATFSPPPFSSSAAAAAAASSVMNCGQASRDCESGQTVQCSSIELRSKSLNDTRVKRIADLACGHAAGFPVQQITDTASSSSSTALLKQSFKQQSGLMKIPSAFKRSFSGGRLL